MKYLKDLKLNEKKTMSTHGKKRKRQCQNYLIKMLKQPSLKHFDDQLQTCLKNMKKQNFNKKQKVSEKKKKVEDIKESQMEIQKVLIFHFSRQLLKHFKMKIFKFVMYIPRISKRISTILRIHISLLSFAEFFPLLLQHVVTLHLNIC